jgi:chromosome segregation ATPase
MSSNQFLANIRQPTDLLSVDSQTDHASMQHSLTQTDHLEETREHIQHLEEALSQKESAINVLMGERDHLNRLYAELHAAYEKLQVEFGEVKQALVGKEQVSAIIGKSLRIIFNFHDFLAQKRNNETEHFRASIAELQQNITHLISERDTLQQTLNQQRQYFDEEIARREASQQQIQQTQNSDVQAQNDQFQEEIATLRHQIVQLRSESMYNAQLANERDYFRQQLNDLLAQHEHEIEVLKRDLHREHEINVQREPPFPVLNVDFCKSKASLM